MAKLKMTAPETDRQALFGLVEALKAYVDWNGLEHRTAVDDGVGGLCPCPEDDTCDCPEVLALSEALGQAMARLEHTVEDPERVRQLTEALAPFAAFRKAPPEPADFARARQVIPVDGRLFRCSARKAATDPPMDCGWPWCGCDPSADRVLSQLSEEGGAIVRQSWVEDVGAFLFDVQANPMLAGGDLDKRADKLAEQLKLEGHDVPEPRPSREETVTADGKLVRKHWLDDVRDALSTCEDCGKQFPNHGEMAEHRRALRQAADQVQHAYVDKLATTANSREAALEVAQRELTHRAKQLGTTEEEIRKHQGKVAGQ